MKYSTLFRVLPICAVLTLALTGCRRDQNELAHNHHSETEEASAHDTHEHDHEGSLEESEANGHTDEIKLDEHRAEIFGVKTAEVQPADFAEVVRVSGELSAAPSARGTVTARSAGIVHLTPIATPGAAVNRGQVLATVSGKGMAGGDSNESARVALQAAKRELDRITPLHRDGIVSTRDYNAALQAYESAKAAAGSATSAGSSATAPSAGVVSTLYVSEGQFVDAGAPIADILANDDLMLRANLPENQIAFLPSVTGAKFRTAYSPAVVDIADFNGHRLAQTAVASQGYIPVFFSLKNVGGRLSAGSFCEVYLQGNPRQDVISLPISALSEQQGEHFVYVQVHPDAYDKRPVTLGAQAGDRVEILSGIAPGEKVVTEGVTFVRLAETSGAVPAGHSHNH